MLPQDGLPSHTAEQPIGNAYLSGVARQYANGVASHETIQDVAAQGGGDSTPLETPRNFRDDLVEFIEDDGLKAIGQSCGKFFGGASLLGGVLYLTISNFEAIGGVVNGRNGALAVISIMSIGSLLLGRCVGYLCCGHVLQAVSPRLVRCLTRQNPPSTVLAMRPSARVIQHMMPPCEEKRVAATDVSLEAIGTARQIQMLHRQESSAAAPFGLETVPMDLEPDSESDTQHQIRGAHYREASCI